MHDHFASRPSEFRVAPKKSPPLDSKLFGWSHSASTTIIRVRDRYVGNRHGMVKEILKPVESLQIIGTLADCSLPRMRHLCCCSCLMTLAMTVLSMLCKKRMTMRSVILISNANNAQICQRSACWSSAFLPKTFSQSQYTLGHVTQISGQHQPHPDTATTAQ